MASLHNQSENRLLGLDVLRATAILAVLFLHTNLCVEGIPTPIRNLFSMGWAGVDLFFTLSGFLIGSQVFREGNLVPATSSLGEFWTRRWFRTLPLYFSVLFVYVFIKPLFGFPFVGWNASYLFFFQNYRPLNDFGQSWSLCIEEQFYLVFPLLIYVAHFKKRHASIWLLPIALSIGLRAFALSYQVSLSDRQNFQIMDEWIRFPAYTHLDGISAGVFLAATQKYWKSWKPRHRHWIGLLSIIEIFGVLFFDHDKDFAGSRSVFNYALLALGFSGVIIAFFDLKIKLRLSRFIEKIALWSYGAYLWNNLLIRLLNRSHFAWPWYFGVSLFIAMSFFVAAITYYWIERPGLNLRARVLARFS
jgi:peptidoglycan/LPS O-acetylase OafA/YrhL